MRSDWSWDGAGVKGRRGGGGNSLKLFEERYYNYNILKLFVQDYDN